LQLLLIFILEKLLDDQWMILWKHHYIVNGY